MSLKLETCNKSPEDAKIVMLWRNNPETRQMFYNQEEKEWESFWLEYQETYFLEENLPPYFVVNEINEKVGFLRSSKYKRDDLAGKTYDIDINVNPSMRGKGYGTDIIKMFSDFIFSSGADQIVAEIKKINPASIKAFKKAGYEIHDEMVRTVKENKFEIFRLILRKK
jgi:RimJ/RimL family protein N-acetyltransferase